MRAKARVPKHILEKDFKDLADQHFQKFILQNNTSQAIKLVKFYSPISMEKLEEKAVNKRAWDGIGFLLLHCGLSLF